MGKRQRNIADTVKDNVRREWDEQVPRDWRDWLHWATDGWLEPFDRDGKTQPLLLIIPAVFIIALFLI